MIKAVTYPRAAVIGNPSDGFFGKTIAFPFSQFQAEARLTEREGIVINPSAGKIYADLNSFSQAYLQEGIDRENPLLSGTVKKFHEFCLAAGITLHDGGFEVTFESTIPREVGLAGSSAIITAILRTLLDYYQVSIAREHQANLILEVETKEMGIGAGLQDRVVQVFEQPVSMDFALQLMENQGYGDYQELSAELFQNIYIAYRAEAAESSEVIHNDLGNRFRNGDKQVHAVMAELSGLTEAFLNELKGTQNPDRLGAYMNRNFDLRQSICSISRNNLEMIEAARSEGASAKFTGSGGAIIGVYKSDKMYESLRKSFSQKGIKILKPTIVSTKTC